MTCFSIDIFWSCVRWKISSLLSYGGSKIISSSLSPSRDYLSSSNSFVEAIPLSDKHSCILDFWNTSEQLPMIMQPLFEGNLLFNPFLLSWRPIVKPMDGISLVFVIRAMILMILTIIIMIKIIRQSIKRNCLI